MAEDCEIVVNAPQQLELVNGKVWCSAPEDDDLEVSVPIRESTLPVVATLRCPTKSMFQCEATPSLASCSSAADTLDEKLPETASWCGGVEGEAWPDGLD